MILTNINFNKLKVIKERVFARVSELHGTLNEHIRIIKEEPACYGVDSTGFECEYEVIIDNEIYTVNLWGSYDKYLYSLHLLCECERSQDF